MFALTQTPRPQPTVLLSMALPGCGSVADHLVRDQELAGSIPATPTMTAMVGSEAKASTFAVAIATGTNDRRANKRGEATTDN